MLSTLLDFFFPRKSLQGSEGTHITSTEYENIKLTPTLLTESALQKRGIQSIESIIAAGNYHSSPLLKVAIRKFKYTGDSRLHRELGTRLADAVQALRKPDTDDILPMLCPVPLHWTRKFHRGFNQAELLGQIVSKHTAWPMSNLLKRTRPTGHQAHRKRRERLSALQDAFRYIGPVVIPDRVILVDDLCTTGATLTECAYALKKAGVRHVEAIVLAEG